MLIRIFLVFLLLISGPVDAGGLKSIKALGKVIGETYEEAKAAEAAKDVAKAKNLNKELQSTESSRASMLGVVGVTNKIIERCNQGKSFPETSWCSSQKDKIYSCIETKIGKGMLLDAASKECENEIIKARQPIKSH